MTNSYYQIPFQAATIMHQEEHMKCTLGQSVASMLHLIVCTHYGEAKHDEGFGSEIWEHDFENNSNTQKFKEQLRTSLKASIERNEKRFSLSRLDVQIEQVESIVQNRRTKSKVSIILKGKLKQTNEDFNYSEQFFIGPLSYSM